MAMPSRNQANSIFIILSIYPLLPPSNYIASHYAQI
jgi:hypothetical protein